MDNLEKPELKRQFAFENVPKHVCSYCGGDFICSIVSNKICKCKHICKTDENNVCNTFYFCDRYCLMLYCLNERNYEKLRKSHKETEQ